MKDLFGKDGQQEVLHLNIYADEIQSKICPMSGDSWHYIGLIIENLAEPLLEGIIGERFMNNFDENSSYFSKNNVPIHWSDIRSADTKNVCKRWFEYILTPQKSEKSFYSYILGLNDSKLIKDEFDLEDQFNSKYNRFFRSAILYSLKSFFPNKKIVVENIFHEIGQQENNEIFPWYSIYKLKDQNENIKFKCNEIVFLPKDHRQHKHSNIIQLCDCVLGASTSIIHGIEKSNNSKYREELADLYLPLLNRIVNEGNNRNSSYRHYKRVAISFFPREKTEIGDIRRLINQFYTKRDFQYILQKSGQGSFFNLLKHF